MKIVAVGTLKGGTGKTTMTFNMAGALALDHRVLLIDVDPQCNLSNNTGVDITYEDAYSSIDIFENPKVNPSDLIITQPIDRLPNLDIIPSNIRLIETELRIGNRTARERILSNYIEDNRRFFERYDYILMDTNPSMGIVNQNAFLAADDIILVTDVDDNSRIGLHLFMYLWGGICRDLRKQNNISALIINKADVRTRLTWQIREYCESDEELSPILLKHPVRSKVAFAHAALQRLPVVVCEGCEVAAEQIMGVVNELKEREVF